MIIHVIYYIDDATTTKTLPPAAEPTQALLRFMGVLQAPGRRHYAGGPPRARPAAYSGVWHAVAPPSRLGALAALPATASRSARPSPPTGTWQSHSG